MASGNDMKAASDTYGGFITMVKFGTIASVLVVAFVIFLMVS